MGPRFEHYWEMTFGEWREVVTGRGAHPSLGSFPWSFSSLSLSSSCMSLLYKLLFSFSCPMPLNDGMNTYSENFGKESLFLSLVQ